MLTYGEYIKTPEWGRIRNEAMSRAEWRCQVCGIHSSNSPLEAHHRSYRRLGKPGELKDLIVLCEHCHGLFHDKGKTA